MNTQLMRPTIHRGDLVYVDVLDKELDDGLIAIERSDWLEPRVFRLTTVPGGDVELSFDQLEWASARYPRSEVELMMVGRVKAVVSPLVQESFL